MDATYNDLLKDNFIYIDYLDANDESCVYGITDINDKLTRLKDIKKLRVYFIAGTYDNGTIYNNNDHAVKLPYYTEDGTSSYGYNRGVSIMVSHCRLTMHSVFA